MQRNFYNQKHGKWAICSWTLPGQKKFTNNSAAVVKTEITPEPVEKIVRANFTGQTDEEAFGPSFLYEEPEIFVETREIPTNTNYMRYNQNRNNDVYENNEEDEDYPQNNICYKCGKQLKWEHMCPDCGVSNLDYDDYIHPVYADTEVENAQDEDYPQNNICYECGKQLKWEHICPDCGISNLDKEEEEQQRSSDVHPEYMNEEKSLESFMKEMRDICNKAGSEMRDFCNTAGSEIDTVERNLAEIREEIIPKVNIG